MINVSRPAETDPVMTAITCSHIPKGKPITNKPKTAKMLKKSTINSSKRNNRFTSRCNGVYSVLNSRASLVSLLAKLSSPTRVASTSVSPVTQKLPDNTSSPGSFKIRSDSPVRADSSTSIFPSPATTPSTEIWSPARITNTSPRTNSDGSTRCSAPSRNTDTFTRASRAIWSNCCLARTS